MKTESAVSGKLQILDREYFLSEDVVCLSKDLLGKRLCVHNGQGKAAGRIVETEAYDGLTDRASHAYGGRRTRRTEIFYHRGGIAYVYLCYGIHSLFNIITGPEEVPHAVLIRAIEPLEGIDLMLKRRNQQKVKRNTGGGPALVSQALGITLDDNGRDLTDSHIWLEDDGFHPGEIIASPRVGIDYAGDDAQLDWRFRIAGSRFTSPAK